MPSRATPSDGARGDARVLVAALMAQASAATVQQGFPSLAPLLVDSLSLTAGQLQLVLAAPLAGLALSVYGWGWLADHVGDRFALALGMGIGAAGMTGVGLSHAFLPTFLLLLVGATGGSAAHAAGGRAVVHAYPPRRHGFVLGLRHMMIPCGGATGAAVLPALAGLWTPSHACLALAAGNLVAALAAWTLLPSSHDVRATAAPTAAADAATATATAAGAPTQNATSNTMMRLSAGAGLFGVLQFALLTYAALYLHQVQGWSAIHAGLAIAGAQVVAGVARVAAGVLSDRVGSRTGVIAGAAAISAVLCAGLAWGAVVPAVLLLAALPAAFCWNGVLYAAVASVGRRERTGTSFGTQTTILALAGTVAPLIMGTLVSAHGWNFAFAMVALGALAAAVVFEPPRRVRVRAQA